MKNTINYVNFIPKFTDWTKFKFYFFTKEILESWKPDWNAENIKKSNFFYTLINKYLTKKSESISQETFQKSNLKLTEYTTYIEFNHPNGDHIRIDWKDLLNKYATLKNFSDHLNEFDEKTANMVSKIKWIQKGGVLEYFKQENYQNVPWFFKYMFFDQDDDLAWNEIEEVLVDKKLYLETEGDEWNAPIQMKFFVTEHLYEDFNVNQLTNFKPKELREYIRWEKNFDKVATEYGLYFDYLSRWNDFVKIIIKQEKVLNNVDLDEESISHLVVDPQSFINTRYWNSFKSRPFTITVDFYGDIEVDFRQTLVAGSDKSHSPYPYVALWMYIDLHKPDGTSKYFSPTDKEKDFYLQNYKENPNANFETIILKELMGHPNTWIAQKAKSTQRAIDNYYKYYAQWKDIPQEYDFWYLISVATTEQEHELISKYYEENHNYFKQLRDKKYTLEGDK